MIHNLSLIHIYTNRNGKAKQQPVVDRYIKTAKHAREEIKHGNSKPCLLYTSNTLQ